MQAESMGEWQQSTHHSGDTTLPLAGSTSKHTTFSDRIPTELFMQISERLELMVSTASRSSHWLGTANRGHWELRAAVPVDTQTNTSATLKPVIMLSTTVFQKRQTRGIGLIIPKILSVKNLHTRITKVLLTKSADVNSAMSAGDLSCRQSYRCSVGVEGFCQWVSSLLSTSGYTAAPFSGTACSGTAVSLKAADGLGSTTIDTTQLNMSVTDPTAWATAMNNLGMVPVGLAGQQLVTGGVDLDCGFTKTAKLRATVKLQGHHCEYSELACVFIHRD
ncbi:Ecto-NOX disulfide-thiol exchanger 1 [Chelonia mydas]|uniref:Ecto-NOX disulfide-thiol exchanger 1 n=1 Tax=Chelonia mydas TaxID=8469 RepID=M7B8V1_CHEMY|nr:Ecto-NOX disulfide-thiol exchanger 1 [Chelonia mydas]